MHRKFIARACRHAEALNATKLWFAINSLEQREALLSAGGPGVGSVWNRLPDHHTHYFPNAHFRIMVQRRVWVIDVPEGKTCAIPRASRDHNPERCGATLDRTLLHSQLCGEGVARSRAHRNLSAATGKNLRHAKADVDYERVIPEMARIDSKGKFVEAVLDLAVRWPGATFLEKVDVTIRCPHASHYSDAFFKVGLAAKTAEKEKYTTYGDSVLPNSFETYGRIGVRSRDALRTLAQHASDNATDKTTRGWLAAEWQPSLERTVLFSVADNDLLALGHSYSDVAGRLHRRNMTGDLRVTFDPITEFRHFDV